MADEQRTLTANFTADSSGFAAGADEVKKKLTELNTALTQNKQAIKETNSEITKNRKEYDQLQKQIKESGEATEEQEQRLQELNDEYAQLSAKMGSLKTAETTLKQQIKSTTGEMSNQKSATDKLKKSASDLGKELASAAAVIGAASAAIFGLTAKYGAWADDMNTLSVQTGLSTEELQKFSIAAGVCDVELSDVTGSITKLKNNMQLARDGSAQLVSTFDALGVSFSNADGSLRDATTVFYEIVEAMGGIENATERDAYAMDLFGRSATQLNTLLVDGGKSFREYSDSMSKYVLPQETLDRLNSFNDQLDTLKARGNSVAAMVGAEFSEAFDGAFDAGNKFFDMIEESIENGDFAEFAEELADGVVAVGEAVANTVGFLWEHKEAVLATIVAWKSMKVAIAISKFFTDGKKAIKDFTDAVKKSKTAISEFDTKTNGALTKLAKSLGIVTAAVATFNAIGIDTTTTSEKQRQAYEALKEEEEELREQQEKLNEEAREYKEAAEGVSDIAEEYKTIKNTVDDTSEANQRLYNLQKDLIDQYGSQAAGIDLVNGKYEDQLGLLDDIYEKNREVGYLAAESALLSAQENARRATTLAPADGNDLLKYFNWDYYSSEMFGDKLTNIKFTDAGVQITGTLDEQYQTLSEILRRYRGGGEFYSGGNSAEVIGWFTGAILEIDEKRQELANAEETFARYTAEETQANLTSFSGSAMAEHERAKGIARLSRQEQLQTMSAEELAQLQEQYKTEKQLADDLYSVREISDAEYYSRLEALRDEYLKSNTHEWYTATSELMKLMDKTGDSLADPIKETFDGISDAYKKLLDDIDRELEKHNRELEDTEYTEKIQAVTARLTYEKLDTFSRKELEKELADLNAEWGEVKYQRGAEDKRDILNQVYTQSQAMMETAPSGVSTAQWNAAVNAAFDTISNSVMTGKTTQAPAVNKVYNIVVQGANKTTEQIVREVTAAIASGAI